MSHPIIEQFLMLYNYFSNRNFINIDQVEYHQKIISNMCNHPTNIQDLPVIFRELLNPIAYQYWEQNKLKEFDDMVTVFKNNVGVRAMNLSFQFSSNDSESSDSSTEYSESSSAETTVLKRRVARGLNSELKSDSESSSDESVVLKRYVKRGSNSELESDSESSSEETTVLKRRVARDLNSELKSDSESSSERDSDVNEML